LRKLLCVLSGSSRTEEAAELYTKAGNTFKMAKKWAGKLWSSDDSSCSSLAFCTVFCRS